MHVPTTVYPERIRNPKITYVIFLLQRNRGEFPFFEQLRFRRACSLVRPARQNINNNKPKNQRKSSRTFIVRCITHKHIHTYDRYLINEYQGNRLALLFFFVLSVLLSIFFCLLMLSVHHQFGFDGISEK